MKRKKQKEFEKNSKREDKNCSYLNVIGAIDGRRVNAQWFHRDLQNRFVGTLLFRQDEDRVGPGGRTLGSER